MDLARSCHIPEIAWFHLLLKHRLCSWITWTKKSPTNININKQTKSSSPWPPSTPIIHQHPSGLGDHHQGLGRIVETSCVIPARSLHGIQMSCFAFLVAKGTRHLGALTSAETQLAEPFLGYMCGERGEVWWYKYDVIWNMVKLCEIGWLIMIAGLWR
jgi:hypothetical protein